TEKYGELGSPEREEFEARAKAYYYAELLKEQRKQQKMTQQQLADKIGKKREYISNIERGNSDMQLSTFMQIANALGLRFVLVVG
ncbi:MAG: helix-turn-helix transcriptional regulator, partial [Prevotella sp.]|nr:helix-turn-helix transcriptional regulator [Prevotella sp.]